MIRRLHRWADRLLGSEPPPEGGRALVIAGAAVVAIAVVGWLDYLTGPQISVELLYIPPVALVALLFGRRAGFLLTAVSALSTLIADVALSPRHAGHGVVAWNLLIRSSVFCLIVVLLAALQSARAAADRSSQASREFLGRAAHQLRTPVAGVRAAAEATLLRGADGTQEQLLAHLATEATRASDLITSMLRMARLDDGQLPPAVAGDAVEVCHDEVSRWRSLRPDLRIELEISEATPPRMLLSRDTLADALANLLENAARHAAGTVHVSVGPGPGGLEIAVADDGPGLAPGTEDRVFGRFVSLDGRGGAGLGLAIARSLVASSGGSLDWEDARFVIRLPLAP